MEEKKKVTLYILEILKTYSDELHPLSTGDILSLLDKQYGALIERRTVYRTIDTLNDLGYTIKTWKDNGSGYYLTNRDFNEGEIILLCNAIHSSNFISITQSEELIRKLLKTQSKYQSRLYIDSVYKPNRKKMESDDLTDTLQILTHAIKDNICISFTYKHYNVSKKCMIPDTEIRTFEPRYIVYYEERPYLAATVPGTDTFRHFRIDRMADICPLYQKPMSRFDKTDAYEYAKDKFFMFTDEKTDVTFHIQEDKVPLAVDFFGKDLMFIKEKDGYRFHVRGSKTGLLLFAQRNIDCMYIIEPEFMKEEMRTILENAMQHYKKR